MRASFLFGEVFNGLRRNVTMTVAMILTVAVSLTMLGGGLLAVRMADKTEQYFLDRLEVRLYLTEDVSASDPDCAKDPCKALMSDLKATPGVVTVQFLNRGDAIREAKEKTFKDQPELAQYVSESPLPASLRVKMADAGEYPRIFQKFQGRPGVGFVRNDKDIVDRLVSLFDGLRNAAFGLAVLQALAALLLIANMVQIAAFTRRTEVGIMRLVGATRWYTQLPFLLEAVAAALAGSALALLGLLAARPLVIDRALGDLFASKVFPRITGDDIAIVAMTIVPVGIVFAALTAYGTLRYYVRE
ncbi:permease-like cell division protein FtsX [Nocardia sp. CDC159]|uniref:Cell division protein FtsX n=1 Tax=Nocardia pulmonis TaxID=2951408 RepID=A0A9X2E8W3_9NOCA|nr:MULTISPECIES: permease-like cell division protein FtsX [Nocardia]MCM6776297.1 permease-like cell division protein FtsX [Nocardia pulmonis]MCM6788721.1 permease-like cell division protein FtsX [Nocardia sp. CDC159]